MARPRLPAPPLEVRALVPAPEVEWVDGFLVVFSGPSGPHGWHARQSFSECPQKWAYESLLRIEPIEGRDPLVHGSLVHQGVAQHWARVGRGIWGSDAAGRLLPAPPLALPREAMVAVAPRLRATRKQLDTALACIGDYLHEIGDPESSGSVDHVLGVEVRLSTTIGGRAYTQRADRIVWRDGGVWIVDTKSTGRIEAKAVKGWSMSGQFSGYRLLGARVFGAAFRGCVIERLQLSPFRMKSVVAERAVALDGRRFELAVRDLDDEKDRLLGRWTGDASRRLLPVLPPRDPWLFPKAMSEVVCLHRYGTCDFLELCREGKAALGAFRPRGEAAVPPSAREPDPDEGELA